MRAYITYTSDWNNKDARTEEINTIEDIINLIKKEKHSIILNHSNQKKYFDLHIEIYDSYRE